MTELRACPVCELEWRGPWTDCPGCLSMAGMKAVSDLQTERAAAISSPLGEARTDLRPWVQHKDDCEIWMTLEDGDRMIVPKAAGLKAFRCTCGLEAALASQGAESPSPSLAEAQQTIQQLQQDAATCMEFSGADAHLGTLRAAGYVQHLPKCRKRSKRMIIHNGARIQEGTAPFVQCTCGLSSKLAALIAEGETRT